MATCGIRNIEQLEAELSRPSAADCEMMSRLDGDLMLLGAGGKMGPSLARLARRAADAVGKPRRVIAVSRFTSDAARGLLKRSGVETIPADLLDPDQVARLPLAPNVLYLAGRKFGSTGRPDLTWAMNVVVPAYVVNRFRGSRVVAFSTGNVYPLRAPESGGSRETDPPDPVGEYAQSCLGRERVFEWASRELGIRCVLFRLNYAVDLRYGVLVDIARRVRAGEPVDLSAPACNVIWQRDANSFALRSLELCESPPRILNVTGPDTVSVRAAAEYFGARFGRTARFQGSEGKAALLSDASLCCSLLGPPEVSTGQLMEWVADWVESGGESLDKPTHFEVTDGRF